jgi:hypothetical protein
MALSRMVFVVAALAVLICIGTIDGKPPQSAAWQKSDETELRTLVASSGIVLELYMDRNGFPHQRLGVPDGFVNLYRKESDECLAVLLDIVRSGKPHDATVAFQFGMAGDEPQIGVPMFVFTSEKELDRPFGEGTETNRQYFVGVLERIKVRRPFEQYIRDRGE